MSSNVQAGTAAEGANWTGFTAVSAVVLLTQLGYYLTAAALPLFLHRLGAAQGRIGVEVGLASVTGLAATLVLGPGINRYGPRTFLVLGSVLYLVAALGMVAVQQEWAVTALRGLQGIGVATVMPSAFTFGSRLVPARPGTALGLLGSINSLALAVGPALGLALYMMAGPPGMLAPAAGAAAIGLLSTLLLPSLAGTGQPARGFGFDRRWIPLLLTNLLGVANFGGIVAYLPLYLQQRHGPNAGIFFTADAVGVLLLRIPTGMIADRYGSLVPIILGLAVTIPGLAALAISPSVAGMIAAGAGTGIGAGLLITGILADLTRASTERNRGTALSLSSASFSAGIFAGSAVSGVLIGPGGFNAILLFGIVTCIAALPLPLIWRVSA